MLSNSLKNDMEDIGCKGIYVIAMQNFKPSTHHRMKILHSVNWNISECPLNAHGMFTENQISGIFQWRFSEHSVPLKCWMTVTFQWSFSIGGFFFRKKSPFFQQIRVFEVILLWIKIHEIHKKNGMPKR